MTNEELDARLANLEKVFKAPPLDAELLWAIKLISPQFDLQLDEESRLYWEADQNGVCWGEYQALKSFFAALPKPKKILEIGPGLGRSIVFFSKKLGWESSKIDAYDGEGESTKYTLMGPRFEDSFCGNLTMLNRVLQYNNINNVTIYDAAKKSLGDLPGPYDLIFSFYAIGFHWSLEYFLFDILKLMKESSVALFTIPKDFVPFPQLEAFPYKIIPWKTVWPKEENLKMLILYR